MATRPIHSMTGFGMAVAEANGLTAQVEIRSVNHRGQKLNVRSRPPLGALEKDLRGLVQGKLSRGAIDVYVTITRAPDPDNPPIREDVARGAVHALRHLAHELDIQPEISARDLLLVPGLFEEMDSQPLKESEWPTLESAATTALEQLLSMRHAEGEATAARLLELAVPLGDFAEKARTQAPKVVDRVRERILARIHDACSDGIRPLDEQSIEREICFIAEKSCINEELDRLASHLDQFTQALEVGGEIGKRLDFLSQEFLREVNTTASKANDVSITGAAVDAKLAVEKIKEQAANLE